MVPMDHRTWSHANMLLANYRMNRRQFFMFTFCALFSTLYNTLSILFLRLAFYASLVRNPILIEELFNTLESSRIKHSNKSGRVKFLSSCFLEFISIAFGYRIAERIAYDRCLFLLIIRERIVYTRSPFRSFYSFLIGLIGLEKKS